MSPALYASLIATYLKKRQLITNNKKPVYLSSYVDVRSTSTHGSSSHQTALYQLVRIMMHNLTVFTCPGLPLISIHHKVLRLGLAQGRRKYKKGNIWHMEHSAAVITSVDSGVGLRCLWQTNY